MNRLNSAKAWYDAQLARLKHIQELSEEHDQEAHLRALLGDLLRVKKGERKVRLKEEREDLYRIALMRLFAGFEADFKEGFFEYVAKRTGMSHRQVADTLPDAVSTWLVMYRVLEPQRFSESLLGQINRIRDERNRLAHGGFHQAIVHTSPDEAYGALRLPLETLAVNA
ncbi:MAG: hypothetical protein IPK82_34985 [Polyangiaceae bacterium]|nr:hypothetical protein [Polyangiaceae bacterium]